MMNIASTICCQSQEERKDEKSIMHVISKFLLKKAIIIWTVPNYGWGVSDVE